MRLAGRCRPGGQSHAEKLGVHESQVSRDERNEYHGATVERAARVLDAMGVELKSRFTEPVLPRGEAAE